MEHPHGLPAAGAARLDGRCAGVPAEVNLNFDMQAFYEEFLSKIRDDQLRFNGNHVNDTGARRCRAF